MRFHVDIEHVLHQINLSHQVKLQTDIIYEPAKGKKASADVASSKIIEILEAPKNNLITGPINSEKQVFKGDQVVLFEFLIEGGNIDSVLNVDITQQLQIYHRM